MPCLRWRDGHHDCFGNAAFKLFHLVVGHKDARRLFVRDLCQSYDFLRGGANSHAEGARLFGASSACPRRNHGRDCYPPASGDMGTKNRPSPSVYLEPIPAEHGDLDSQNPYSLKAARSDCSRAVLRYPTSPSCPHAVYHVKGSRQGAGTRMTFMAALRSDEAARCRRASRSRECLTA
jgi:hypothetical protein